jgi:hypothetical protein
LIADQLSRRRETGGLGVLHSIVALQGAHGGIERVIILGPSEA